MQIQIYKLIVYGLTGMESQKNYFQQFTATWYMNKQLLKISLQSFLKSKGLNSRIVHIQNIQSFFLFLSSFLVWAQIGNLGVR